MTTALLVLAAGLTVAGVALPGPDEEPAYAALAPSAPVRLVVSSLGIDAAVVPISVSPDAVLDPPDDADLVGWWDRSAEPGATLGQTVITGHTVHTGGGTMDDVGRLRPGQQVDVVTRRGTLRYEVDRVAVLTRDQVARRSSTLFGQDRPGGRLVLVTCTDWNGTVYENNVMVFARPLGRPLRDVTAPRAAP